MISDNDYLKKGMLMKRIWPHNEVNFLVRVKN